MRVAKKFDIIRNVDTTKKRVFALREEPIALYIVTDEPMFEQLNYAMVQNTTTRIQDKGHDWRWEGGHLDLPGLQDSELTSVAVHNRRLSDGRLYYSGVQGSELTLLAVYGDAEDGRTLYCGECGAHAALGCEHNLEAS